MTNERKKSFDCGKSEHRWNPEGKKGSAVQRTQSKEQRPPLPCAKPDGESNFATPIYLITLKRSKILCVTI